MTPAPINAAISRHSQANPPWGTGRDVPDARDRPLRPLPLPEHGHATAVRMHTVDVGPVRADHPVDVDEAAVAALRRDLLGRQRVAVDEALGVALAERDVAGRVLVEQRVEEQQPAPRSARNAAPAPPRPGGARPRRCRAPCSAPLRPVRPGLDDAPGLEPHGDAVDQGALVGQRLRAATVPSTRPACGVVKTSSVGMFGLQVMPFLAGRGAAVPVVAVGEADRQVGAGAGEVQRVNRCAFSQSVRRAARRCGPPRRRRGRPRRRARRRRSRPPAWRRRCPPAHRREHLPGPGGAGVGEDVPVDVEAGDLLQRRLVGRPSSPCWRAPTLSGSCPASSMGSSPTIASRAALSANAFAMPSYSQPGARSKLASAPWR